MLGVRFSAVCTIVLGGVLVSSAAYAAQICDQRSARACKPAATQSSREAPRATTRTARSSREAPRATTRTAQSSREAPRATTRTAQSSREAPNATTTKTAQRAATANRSRRTARRRHEVRHAQSDKPAPRQVESSTAPATAAPTTPNHAPEPSPSERRFSEFVSPRSFAANPVEALHKPRMNVAELSAQTAYPLTEHLDPEPSAAAAAPAPTETAPVAPAPSPVTVTDVEAPSPARQQIPAALEAEPSVQLSAANPVRRPADRDGSDGSTSWVRIAFLTWGGLLTLGSALRLLIG